MLGFDAIAETALAEVPFLVPATTGVVPPTGGGKRKHRRPHGAHLRPYERVLYRRDEHGLRFPVSLLEELEAPGEVEEVVAAPQALIRPIEPEAPPRFDREFVARMFARTPPRGPEPEAPPVQAPELLSEPPTPAPIASPVAPEPVVGDALRALSQVGEPQESPAQPPPELHALLDQTTPPLGQQPQAPPVEIPENFRGSVGPEEAPSIVPEPPEPALNVPPELGPSAGSIPSVEEVEQQDIADAMQAIKEIGDPAALVMEDVEDVDDAMSVLSQLGNPVLDINTQREMVLLTSTIEQMKQPVQTAIQFMRDEATGKIIGAKLIQVRKQ